nr:MAG TPA_asm: hypothetical protein [Caudoviricetes sp.]
MTIIFNDFFVFPFQLVDNSTFNFLNKVFPAIISLV